MVDPSEELATAIQAVSTRDIVRAAPRHPHRPRAHPAGPGAAEARAAPALAEVHTLMVGEREELQILVPVVVGHLVRAVDLLLFSPLDVSADPCLDLRTSGSRRTRSVDLQQVSDEDEAAYHRPRAAPEAAGASSAEASR